MYIPCFPCRIQDACTPPNQIREFRFLLRTCAVFANLKADLRNAIRFSAGVCEVGWLNSPPPQSTSSVIDVKVRMSLMIDGQAVSHECPVEYPYPYKDGKRCFETNLEEKFKAVTVGTKGFLTKKSTS
ncbi:uncharacterized protein LOC111707712 isoform X2 [Eurytemora carolleeae]|uniref:uncharacterized protein LOC111707712 isoform X2 n=1 Tax=Eurytemora carolleeae TaxID=1294199 RepID=UPI000C76FC0D|nr:uncharacterized protein LOC111707712 isoform X2 [Eurytemora carolleeae]|eukprot:XP_023336620.1 uncharacterized protein LOC111707712 isoform X2 [Eurytemora affinis]